MKMHGTTIKTSWTVRVCGKAPFRTTSEGLRASIVTAWNIWSSLSTIV